MHYDEIYILLLIIIFCVGMLSRKISAPTPLLLVIAGMLLSFFPHFPVVNLDPEQVFYIFLPLLIYEATAYTSWPDVKSNKRFIALLSIGHVIFITIVVAIVAHHIIPGLGWPLAFVLGALISPPDDVAIFAIAEKVRIPQRVLTVLMGEGLLNDATALILFRFSLVAALTHSFSASHAVFSFLVIIICETFYGLVLGHVLGQIRIRITDPMLQILLSILTPFFAYWPATFVGGSGVLATVVTGLVIGHVYLERLTPEIRLLWTSIWKTIGFTLSSVLFLLVGLHLRKIVDEISLIPVRDLIDYGSLITLVVVVGRFVWVFASDYLPRYFFKSYLKNDPYPPWQYPFIVSWAGMRGGVSLAAALTIPVLATTISHTNARSLIIFLVFCVIVATLLLQGLTLPWLLKALGVEKMGLQEQGTQHLNELMAQDEMVSAVLNWLKKYEFQVKKDSNLDEEIKIQQIEYQSLRKKIRTHIENYDAKQAAIQIPEAGSQNLLYTQIIDVERSTLMKLWREGKISFGVKIKLLQLLDLRSKRYSD